MFKKVIPVLFVSGVVLAGCGNNDNDTVPNKNETPMESLENRDLTPRVNDGQTGPDMDGINADQERYNNPNGGILNDTNRNGLDGRVNDRNRDMNGNNVVPSEDIIIDENTTTPSRNNGTMDRNGNSNR
ncbi:hypothetical protein NCCP2222_33790 [Sporosarcina sp. NCCP-2222]|uniref:hypothetical protein n=1 Tax=Sporosarcina sp. NCCP-2222 TaxID=2935073 RepID=UPI0020825620|nr:hypothetical protein [Sporosarcina sp. NCCP-2222]GKV57432.1 hypothetical protein NCCP2222_33790 [Sporosarcina sp. NCCP-2222]